MRQQVGRQVSIGRRLVRNFFLGHHIHLLADATLDHVVVAVEAERVTFAVEDFVVDVGLDQALEFLRRRWPVPGRLVLAHELIDLGLADDNAPGIAIAGSDMTVVEEQREPNQQEMQ